MVGEYKHRTYTAACFPLVRGVLIAGIILASAGCRKRVSPTHIRVADSVRHYYPIVTGDKLRMTYVIKNEGSEPFMIDEIHPSCGCIVKPIDVKAIPPHDSLTLFFTFDSSKNIGYVCHKIRLYGNVLPRGMATLVFDVNVVPPSSDQPDYEETYQKKKDALIKEMVDGAPAEKGYYVSPGDEKDSRSYNKYPWRE